MHHLAEISIDRLVNDTTLVSGSHWERVIRSGNTKLSCCGLIHSMHLTYTLAPFFPLTGSQDRGYFVSFFFKGSPSISLYLLGRDSGLRALPMWM